MHQRAIPEWFLLCQVPGNVANPQGGKYTPEVIQVKFVTNPMEWGLRKDWILFQEIKIMWNLWCQILQSKIHTCFMWGTSSGTAKNPGRNISDHRFYYHPRGGTNWFWGNDCFSIGKLVGRDECGLSEVTADLGNTVSCWWDRIWKRTLEFFKLLCWYRWLIEYLEGRKLKWNFVRLHWQY